MNRIFDDKQKRSQYHLNIYRIRFVVQAIDQVKNETRIQGNESIRWRFTERVCKNSN